MPTTTNQESRVDADAKVDTSALLVGKRIGKYDIVRIVGKGGMGCVYEAVNTTIQKRVAIKCIDHELAKNVEAYERFHREALAASAIESPHIVQIFDAGKTEEGVPFIVMELLRGTDLGGYLGKVGRLPVNDALHVTIHALKGLHHAHTAGIVHRDLKPDNIFLVDRDEEPVFVKLLDFGVSKISRTTDVPLETLTRQGTVVGTPFYMSPEQAQAFPDVDTRTDIYSIGALLFECLAGRPPHVGKSYEQVIVSICMKDVDDIRTHNPSVPAGVAEVIKKALSREREDRFATAREMLNALVDGSPASFRQATPSSKLRGVSLGGAEGSIAHTPMVISPVPASRVPSGLADTVTLDEDEDDPRDAALTESGVSPKSDRATLPSDNLQPVTSVAAPLVAEPESQSGAKPRRRWALAAAPGIALLLALALFISFRGGPDADADSEVAAPAAADAKPGQAVGTKADEEQKAKVEPKEQQHAQAAVVDSATPLATAQPSITTPVAPIATPVTKPPAPVPHPVSRPQPVAPQPATKPPTQPPTQPLTLPQAQPDSPQLQLQPQ